jgi:hypothetical protein
MLRSLSLMLITFLACEVNAAVNDYIYPIQRPSYSNYGGLGLIQMPNARFYQAGSLAFSWTHNEPYLRGSILAYPFYGVEASYQYTDVNNALYSPFKEFSGSQSFKDKSFDLKLLALKETKFFPQIAVGLRDLAGSGLFSSEYIVASKFIKNVDISIGLGWGILDENSRFKNPFTLISDRFNSRQTIFNQGGTKGGEFNTDAFFGGTAGIFGGIELYLPKTNGVRLKVEYDATNYRNEGFEILPQDSKVNYGLVYSPFKSVDLKLGYARGNTLTFGFSFSGFFAERNSGLKKNDDHKVVEKSEVVKRVLARSDDNIYKLSLAYLTQRGLFLQKANVTQDEMHVAFSHNAFRSYPRAAGRVARTLDEMIPDRINKFKITYLNGELSLHTVEVNRSDIKQAVATGSIYPITSNARVYRKKYDPEDFKFHPAKELPKFLYSIGPDLRSQIGGPDGFYFGDLRIALNGEYLITPNLTIIASAGIGLFNNMDDLKLDSDSIIPKVRTEIVKYLKQSDEYNIKRLQLNYFQNPIGDIYTKLSAGYLESMFAGVGGEFLYKPFYKNYAIGAEMWRVRKRDYNQMLGLQKYMTTTGHINVFYLEPRSKVLLTLRGGKYLARDSGITIDFSRRFDSGVHIGSFFSITDISKEEFGEGSFDKGFYFHMPVDLWFTNHRRNLTGFGLRPLTRDGAAKLNHGLHLWGVTDAGNYETFRRDWVDALE